MAKLKILKEGEPLPHDFWNYQVNPILGYEYKIKNYPSKDILKYNKQ
jgi:hypothetical protein